MTPLANRAREVLAAAADDCAARPQKLLDSGGQAPAESRVPTVVVDIG